MANITTPEAGTYIGFKMGKTAAEADALTSADNVLYITPDKRLYIQGERLGLTDTEQSWLTSQIDSVEKAKWKLNVFFHSGSSLDATKADIVSLEKGVAHTFYLHIILTYNGDTGLFADDSEFLNAVTITPSSTNGITVTTDHTSTDGTGHHLVLQVTTTTAAAAFNVKVTENKSGYGLTSTVAFGLYYAIKYGVNADPSTMELLAGATSKVSGSAKGTYTWTFTSDTCPYIAVPTGVTIGKTWTDGNGLHPTPNTRSLTVNSIAYTVCYFDKQTSGSTLTLINS